MREIKFRAWDGKRFEYGITLLDFDTDESGFKWCSGNMGVCMEVTEDLVFLQFTGLKDKNKKEIYEGDVVEWCWCGMTKTTLTTIVFERGKWTFGGEGFPEELFGNKNSCEVIGNIYENPELLEEIK